LDTNTSVDIFKADPNFLENEEKYKAIKAEILGEGSDDEEEDSEEESDEEEGRYLGQCPSSRWANCSTEVAPDKEGIMDKTETNLVNLRRVIYLTIMNALNYEEAVHKLLKVQMSEGQEVRHFFL
jgi:pre-mRNA-splicing factor CWC22